MRSDHTAIEEWRPVVGFEGWYEVSSRGRVRRSKAGPRTNVGRLLKLQRSGGKPGYPYARLYTNVGKSVMRKVHALVAAAFMAPKPNNGYEINHIDGNPWNNPVDNLEWRTHRENVQHAFTIGLVGDRRGSKNANAKLTEAQVLEIRAQPRAVMHTELAALYGVTPTSILLIRQRKTWKNL